MKNLERFGKLFDLTGHVAVVTGAAQGIGRQTAEQAAAEGAALLLIDRSPWVHELAATLAQSGSQVLALEADLEEERRMFYVAMTRAKDRLHVYYVKERYHKKQTVSRFVEEAEII